MGKAKGYTIIEILVVAIILGIVLGIAIPRYLESIERSQRGQAETVLKMIRSAELAYWSELGAVVTMTETYADKASKWAQLRIDVNDSDDWRFWVASSGGGGFTASAKRLRGRDNGTIWAVNMVDGSIYQG